jgi:hypothetical protein
MFLSPEAAMSIKIDPIATPPSLRPTGDNNKPRGFENELQKFLEEHSSGTLKAEQARLQLHMCQLKLSRSLFEESPDSPSNSTPLLSTALEAAGATGKAPTVRQIFDNSMVAGNPLTSTGAPTCRPDSPSSDMEQLITQAAGNHGVAPDLIRSVIRTESGFDPQAVSPAGAQGLMQLMPETAAELGVTNPFDPEQNIMAGTRYLRQLLDRYNGDLDHALAAYNWGMGNVDRHGLARLPEETRNYLLRIKQA